MTRDRVSAVEERQCHRSIARVICRVRAINRARALFRRGHNAGPHSDPNARALVCSVWGGYMICI